ncbi:MAG: preprotein translocase subunit SecG [Xanthomonadales bacterium]|nr:preprotein translocase subunit SecG [Gammaproteobacteria bacterium]MBT8064253.1 preprotein translocase subunit SecG [Gammaproteobacteria bacterium]NNJ65365.1 preprotein translocase subunit SecG [Xanthomonadales bacterium]NNK33174.1 preprotein translocase subunit SecG [Xanthomonadales bacterium]
MQVLNIFHVLIAIGLIAFVLIQKGQGATAGAAFGSGASGTVFGARGAGNFLSRTTWVLATLFCAISLTMAVMVSRMMSSDEPDLGVLGATQQAPVEQTAPAVPNLSSDEPQAVDMPAFDPSADTATETLSPAADDLPLAPPASGRAETEDSAAAENRPDDSGNSSGEG